MANLCKNFNQNGYNYCDAALDHSVDIHIILDRSDSLVHSSKMFLCAANIESFELIRDKHYKTALAPYIHARAIDNLSDIINEVKTLKKTVVKNEQFDFLNTGSPRVFAVNAAPLQSNDENIGTSLRLYDITDMSAAVNKANLANFAKTEFLSNMSHEIRTPLNAVIGMTTIARQAGDIEKVYYCLDKIEESSSHLLGLINNILDISKIEADKLELSYVEFDFKAMLSRIMDMHRHRLEENHIDCKLYVDPRIPIILIGDEPRLSQVLINLLTNAIKFTPVGGSVVLKVSLASCTDTDSITDSKSDVKNCGTNEIFFSVKDSGIGISEEQLERIFIPFSQADSSIHRKYGGTGLGLAISKRIVELMGGNLSVTSRLHNGSEFFFSIQAESGTSLQDEAKAAAKEEVEAPENTDFTGRTILLAEDVEVNREIMITLLEGTGLTIITAANGEEAVKIFNSNPYGFDLIFMDIHMPTMDGFAATRKIRSLEMPRARTIPIIALTANVFKDDVEKCMAAGMNDHLGKPVDISQVFEKMNKYMKIRREKT